MKATEFIRLLQELVAKEGDLDVQIETCSGYECECELCEIDPPATENVVSTVYNRSKRRHENKVTGRIIRIQ